ncbi:MAG TPA: rhomboid family intramembrane serine protease [Gaiellaceae bacterium]|nr:rhomboid family intramembrane serine protease [Gaiellaceae bacterium]
MASPEPRYCYRHPDRETGLSCSECGRPICYECMTPAPVGIRCPEHSGQAHGIQRVRRTAQRASYEGSGAVVTKILIGLNTAIYLLELAIGAGISANSGWIFEHGALIAHSGIFYNGHVIQGVADGAWWRLITAAFLHYGPIHLGMNMLALWWFGAPLEQYLGRGRYLMLYVVSGLAGSAGALIVTPNALTVGASGAIFGILGAAFVLERQGSMVFGGQALAMIVINLVFTFAVGGISIGGHIGGLIGGALCMLAMSRFGRGHAVYGKPGLVGIAGVIGVGVLSVVVAYLAV